MNIIVRKVMFSRLLAQSVGCEEIRIWYTMKCIGRIEFRKDDFETTSGTTVDDI